MSARRTDAAARRRPVRAVAAVAAVAGVAWLSPVTSARPAAAQSASSNAARADAQQEYEHLTAEEVRLFTQYQATVERVTELTAQVDAISASLAEVGVQLTTAEQAVAAADADLRKATDRLDGAER